MTTFWCTACQTTPMALGYFGYAYFAAHKDSLRAVAVQNGASAPPVLPSPATIIDKTYAPLSRPLYIYVKNSAARRGEVGRFLKHYLDKIDQFAVEGGYAPPTAEDKAANQATLAKLLPAATERGRNQERRQRSKEFGLVLSFPEPGERSAAPQAADLWPGHSRALAFWERVVTSGLVFCAAITIFTTAGIILVLGAQSFEFFRLPEVSVTEFFFGTTLRPSAHPPKFGIVPLLWGTFHGRRGLVDDRAADRPFERDLLERILRRGESEAFSSQRSSCWRGFPRSSTVTWPCCWSPRC